MTFFNRLDRSRFDVIIPACSIFHQQQGIF